MFLHANEVAVYYSQATRQETKNRVVGRTSNYFVLNLGIHGIGQDDVDKMKVTFEMTVTDQLKRNHTFKSQAELSRIHTDIRLLSSQTSM